MVMPLWKPPTAEGATQEEKCLIEIYGRVRELGVWHGIPMHDALGDRMKDDGMFVGGLLSEAGHGHVAEGLRDLLRLRVWNRVNELAEAYPREMKALDY